MFLLQRYHSIFIRTFGFWISVQWAEKNVFDNLELNFKSNKSTNISLQRKERGISMHSSTSMNILCMHKAKGTTSSSKDKCTKMCILSQIVFSIVRPKLQFQCYPMKSFDYTIHFRDFFLGLFGMFCTPISGNLKSQNKRE